MKRFKWRPVAVVFVLVVTAVAFIYYFRHHPEVRRQLQQTSFRLLVELLALYLAGIGALALILQATVRLCKISLDGSESLLLTMYSSIVNFFGPLQSGPAFRAVYLKKKYGLMIKQYSVATLVYYFFYAGFSSLFLLSGILNWWLIPLAAMGLLVGWRLPKLGFFKSRFEQIDLNGWYFLALATFLQVAIVGVIYFRELASIAPGTSVSQAIIYTGAANLSLFVSITPGAIGFRETFLLFSQRLHHISDSTIVAASILDRTVYIILMLILAVFIFGTHASRRLQKAADSD
jgi:uncharacterized membrane protein YbhN (UPF0104 family)